MWNMALLEKVGRETVQYVSNIYKYYLAYKLITEREAEQKAARESGISQKNNLCFCKI